MSDSVVLVCAVCASMAVGVLAAYGVCLGFFAAFRMQARQVAVEPSAAMGAVSGAVRVEG